MSFKNAIAIVHAMHSMRGTCMYRVYVRYLEHSH